MNGILLFGESAVQQPSDDGEVAALIVGWEDDGVFILGSRCHVEDLKERMSEDDISLR